MGSSESKFEDNKWEFAHHINQTYDIYQNQQGLLAEKHVIQNNAHVDKSDQMDIYHYRASTSKPIVRVHNAQFQDSESFCGNQSNITVFSQYIPYRLSDVRNLNYGQGLYVLSQALIGFNELFHRVGPFAIDDNNIGFNQKGQVRVWLNKNFANNHLPKDSVILMSTQNPRDFDRLLVQKQEQDMVLDIWNAVYAHSLEDAYPAAFKQYTNNFEEIGFVEARQKVNQAIQDQGTYVPNKLNLESRLVRFGSNVGDSNHVRLQSSSGYHNQNQLQSSGNR